MRTFKTIHIPIPQNLPERYRKLFQKKSTYKVPELGVKEYKNVFVSHEGLCLQNFRLVPYSSFNICTRYDKSFGWQYYKLVLEQYLVSTFGKSLKKITLPSDTTYAVIHTKWFNYSFWITSSLHRLIMLQQLGKDFTLLYPEAWDTIPYVTESLKAFPNLKIYKIPTGVHVQVPHLLMPEVRPFTACFDGSELQTVKNYMAAHIPAEFLTKPYPTKVYITRKKAKYRKVQNEQEVIDFLSPQGFSVIDFDDLSFWEQVALMKGVKEFVSIHGAGFSNIIFMHADGKITELINEAYAELEYTFPFWKQAYTCGHSYTSIFGKPVNETTLLIDSQTQVHSGELLVNQNIIIDLQELKINT
jgi:hypothetical protein